MKRTAVIAATAAALLLLAGCSGTTQDSVTLTSEPVGSPAPSDAPTAEATEPLTAVTPTAEAQDGESVFLAAVRANLRPDNVVPDATDAQLLAAGREACEKIAGTEDTNTVSVIEGEQPNALGSYTDSNVIVTAARASLCD